MASGIEAAEVFPVSAMSRATTTCSGSLRTLTSWSMIRMFAWWGTKTSMSSGVRPAASIARRATGAICHTAHLKTLAPSWRSVGHSPVRWASCHDAVWPMRPAWPPSEPQTVGPIPGTSEGPTTAAPAPSPSRNEMARSVGSMKSDIFSGPTTRTCRATPERTSASAWPMP